MTETKQAVVYLDFIIDVPIDTDLNDVAVFLDEGVVCFTNIKKYAIIMRTDEPNAQFALESEAHEYMGEL
jgi:hypothetical protein